MDVLDVYHYVHFRYLHYLVLRAIMAVILFFLLKYQRKCLTKRYFTTGLYTTVNIIHTDQSQPPGVCVSSDASKCLAVVFINYNPEICY